MRLAAVISLQLSRSRSPFVMDNEWTPQRRRKELSDDGDSQAELTPRTFDATPVKLNTP